MVETGMYLYPWDIGPSFDEFTEEYARTGCNAVAPALSYHHASVLSARSGKIYRLAEAALSFSPRDDLFDRLKPETHAVTAELKVVDRIRDWCRSSGRHFCGWTVILHNSTIGRRHTDACCENAFGDRHTHALCPSNPDVRHYALALVRNICQSLAPDSIMLEAATVPTPFHGEHHEIANVKAGPAALWLFSLCFCPHCMKAAGEADGVDPERTRNVCRTALQALLNTETAIPSNEPGQIAMLLLEYPELYAYQRARQNRVAEFIRPLSAEIRGHDVQCRLIPSSIPHPVNSCFLEGMSFAGTAGLADALVPLVYGEWETFANVEGNIRLADGATPVGMAMTLHPGRYRDRGAFLGAVAEATDHNPACAYFYNFSIASRERLGWIAEAARLLGAES